MKIPVGSLSHKKQQWWCSAIPHKDYMINFSPIWLIYQFFTKLTTIFSFSTPRCRIYRQSICHKSMDQFCAKTSPLLDHSLIKDNGDHQFLTNINQFLADLLINKFFTKQFSIFQHPLLPYLEAINSSRKSMDQFCAKIMHRWSILHLV